MSESFEYKSAPIGGERVLTVGELGAQLRSASGNEKGSIEFSEVDEARFVTHQMRNVTMYRLDLMAGEKLFRIPLNVLRGSASHEPPISTFYKGCAAVLTAISQHKPNLKVVFGEGGKVLVAWFLLGVLSLLIGLGIPLAAWLTDVRPGKIIPALLPLGILVLVGFCLVKSCWPWRPPTTLPIGEMIGVFEAAGTRPASDVQ